MTLETRLALRAILTTSDVCDALDEIASMLADDLACVETLDPTDATEHSIPDAFDDQPTSDIRIPWYVGSLESC